MERKRRWACVLRVLAAFLLLVLLIWLLGRLTEPKYMSSIPEGALIREYYKEESAHQVLFLGDCEVYENFSPIKLWEEYGISSYIRGSAQQLTWQSYYLLEEMLAHETPRVVVFNVLALKYGEPQKEAYNRMTLDGMRPSVYKWRAVKASMTAEESFITYVIPLLRYHSRWNELTGEDFRYLFSRDTVGHSGYLMQTGVVPLTDMPPVLPLEDPALPETSMQYLEKMAELCRENGAELVLIKAPSVYPHWYDEWDAQVKDFAAAHGLSYYNLLEISEEIGIDWQTDTYDAGLHLNVWGAEKLATYFGKILTEQHGCVSEKDDATLSALWERKASDYYAEFRERTQGD